jgi:CheY-like chemotaxis protein/GAF domain-containing protein/PAS domain-containing protein
MTCDQGDSALSERPRILVFDLPDRKIGEFLEECRPEFEIVRVQSLLDGLALLQNEPFEGVYASPRDSTVWERASSLFHSHYILQVLGDGVALVSPDLRITWANAIFQKWCGGDVEGRTFYEALGSPEILGPDYCPFHTALTGKSITTQLHRSDNRYLELHVTPVPDPSGKVRQLISLVRDITAEVQRQHKLDALHQAGRELAALPTAQLAQMSVEERIELLKSKILHFTHDLLHYSVIEIRLLDRQTGRLEPLLEEGMTKEAAGRVLFARTDGNGVTGFVATTGKSYLCPDTENDPLYIEGTQGARSSLTVALCVGDEVIGTFNVESTLPNAFDEQDLQFLEIFSREIALALHTLELLSAEKRSTATASVEAVSREVALPVDEILIVATDLLDRWIGHEPEMEEKLRTILANARAIKQAIQKVGEDLVLVAPTASPEQPAHPRLKGMRVLVADNDERVRRSAHTLLGRFGCIVETARDGKEAQMMARLSSYDAILADIRLPDLSGFETYQKLRKAQPQARVILMTNYGYDPSHSIVKARQEGLRHVLYKPFRVHQLLQALEDDESTEAPPTGGDQFKQSSAQIIQAK